MFQNIFKGRWLGILLLLLVATMPTIVQAANVETSAAIVSLTPSCSGISVTGAGSYQQGIGKVAFVLADLSVSIFYPSNPVVDRKEFSYNSKPLPKQVTESWSSTFALTPGTPYRVVFQVWGKLAPYSGLSLVAYDGANFTCT